MNYELRLSVPKNTPKTAPVEDTLTVHPGVVKEVNILFPSRCAQLAHVQIIRSLQNLWPPYDDMSFTGDGEVVDWEEEYLLDDPPFDFTIRAWNLDDTYPHTVTIRMNVIPLETVTGGGVLKSLVGFFTRFGQGEL